MIRRIAWNALTGVIMCGGLWASVRFMIAALSAFDPSRVPS